MAALQLLAGGCMVGSDDGGGVGRQVDPLAGLHTPGSKIGMVVEPDASTVDLGDRCLTEEADEESEEETGADAGTVPEGTEGTLSVQYTTRSYGGRYRPKNCTAVWIEDAAGQYVATIHLTAGLRRPGLQHWQQHACTDQLGPDAVTSATLRDHNTVHTVTWTGLDALERPVPDGLYTLWLEVTESDKISEPGLVQSFEFEKGPNSQSWQPLLASGGALTQVSLAWTPGTPGDGVATNE